MREFRAALDAAGVQVAAPLPLYLWSGPDEDERQAAVRYWKRAIELTVDLGCDVMNSEFNGRPEAPSASEAQFGTLARIGSDGVATVCVFAWEERAREWCAGNLEKVRRQYVAKYF